MVVTLEIISSSKELRKKHSPASFAFQSNVPPFLYLVSEFEDSILPASPVNAELS